VSNSALGTRQDTEPIYKGETSLLQIQDRERQLRAGRVLGQPL